MADLAKTQNELSTTGRRSSLDSVLARMLDHVSQIYRTELQSGEVRVWQHSLLGKTPETVEWAFLTYFRQGKYPPKPADISELVRGREETVHYDSCHPLDAAERDQAHASRQEYFESDEYKLSVARINASALGRLR